MCARPRPHLVTHDRDKCYWPEQWGSVTTRTNRRACSCRRCPMTNSSVSPAAELCHLSSVPSAHAYFECIRWLWMRIHKGWETFQNFREREIYFSHLCESWELEIFFSRNLETRIYETRTFKTTNFETRMLKHNLYLYSFRNIAYPFKILYEVGRYVCYCRCPKIIKSKILSYLP